MTSYGVTGPQWVNRGYYHRSQPDQTKSCLIYGRNISQFMALQIINKVENVQIWIFMTEISLKSCHFKSVKYKFGTKSSWTYDIYLLGRDREDYVCLAYMNLLKLHTGAETKWSPFHRWHIEMHFLGWKLLYFDLNFTEICSPGFNWQYANISSETW